MSNAVIITSNQYPQSMRHLTYSAYQNEAHSSYNYLLAALLTHALLTATAYLNETRSNPA